MSSKSYKINKWEGFVTPYSTKIQPIVYIEPDTDLLNYAHINGNKFRIKISNSSSLYDNISMIGYFTKPKECCDDNSECNNRSYIFILDTEWKGLPLGVGTIDVYNDSTISSTPTSTSTQQPPLRMLPHSSSTTPTSNSKYTWLLWVIVTLLFLISLIIFILYMYENNGSNDIKPIEKSPIQQPTIINTNVSEEIQHGESSSSIEKIFIKTGLSNEILKNRLIERGKTNFTSN